MSADQFPYSNPFNHSSLVIYLDVIKNVNYYNENYKYSQDFELYYKLFESNYKGFILDEYQVYRRISKNIIGLKKRRSQIFFLILVQLKILFSKNISFNLYKLIYSIIKNLLRFIFPNELIKKIKNAKKNYL